MPIGVGLLVAEDINVVIMEHRRIINAWVGRCGVSRFTFAADTLERCPAWPSTHKLGTELLRVETCLLSVLLHRRKKAADVLTQTTVNREGTVPRPRRRGRRRWRWSD
jgi:hypothetical protein